MEVSADPRRRSIVTAATGDHAPTSGWWRPDDDPEPLCYVQRGETMPSLELTQTLWTLVQELIPQRGSASEAGGARTQTTPLSTNPPLTSQKERP